MYRHAMFQSCIADGLSDCVSTVYVICFHSSARWLHVQLWSHVFFTTFASQWTDHDTACFFPICSTHGSLINMQTIFNPL